MYWRARHLGWASALGALLVLAACDRGKPAVPIAGAGAQSGTRIASLVPAATDLLTGMGAQGHLVAVSNFDKSAPADLPRVGDYQNTDWERIASLKPEVMVIQLAEEKIPAGFRSRAEAMGVKLINVRFESVEDILAMSQVLGEAAGEAKAGAALAGEMRKRLERLRARHGAPRPRVLLAVGDSEPMLANVGTFLNDLLEAAGGENAARGLRGNYVMVDPERLASMDADVIVQIAPGATPAAVAQARRVWEKTPGLRAVKAGRVYFITDEHALLPGSRVVDVAEKLAGLIHEGVAGAASRDTAARP